MKCQAASPEPPGPCTSSRCDVNPGVGVSGDVSLAGQRHLEVSVGLGIIWLKLERPLETPNRFRKVSLFAKRDPQVIVGLWIIGFQLQRSLVVLNGFREFPLFWKGGCQVII